MLYCGIRFGFHWKEIIINNILYLVIVGGIQVIVVIFYGWISQVFSAQLLSIKDKEAFIVNSGVFIIVILILPKLKLHKLSVYLQDKEKILVFFLVFCIVMTVSSVINFKVFDGLNGFQYLILFISIILFCLLAGQVGKYKINSKEIETELRMQKLYADSFYGLIEDIRLRQHEFDNHINAIYSLHYAYNSYEDLVKAQNEYSQALIKENRYNKLLKAGNPLIIGFLYGKFIEVEKYGIEVKYQIGFEDLIVDVPIYKLVEILGNLIKNAVEAMKNSEIDKVLCVVVIESEGRFEIEVRNRSEFIEYSEIDNFFRKGYSKKGENRGLGLYKVKTLCDEYSLKILCENRSINDENWLCFTITNERGTI